MPKQSFSTEGTRPTGRVRLRAGLLHRAIMEHEIEHMDGTIEWRKVPRRSYVVLNLLKETQ